MIALRILSALWLLPVALPVWLVYLGPAWALGWHRRVQHPTGGRWCLVFETADRCPPWYGGLWRNWGGLALPFAVTLNGLLPLSERLLRHELRHIDQWGVLGPLFPLVYGALLPFYGYSRHPLERDAEAHA